MHCSTCGAGVPAGRSACETCGAPVGRGLIFGRATGAADRPAVAAVRRCARCGYEGAGIGYFSRGRSVAALVGLTVVTAGLMGVGGLVFYLVRRDHLVCPRCGLAWGSHGSGAPVAAGRSNLPTSAPEQEGLAVPARLAGAEARKKRLSILLFIVAIVLGIVAVAQAEFVPFVIAAGALGGSFLLRRSAAADRNERRAALVSALQLPVLRLAAERGGRLTVTDVAAALGWSLPRAQKILNSLDDGLHVDSEVTDEGVIVYEFREIVSRPGSPHDTPRLEGGAA